MPHALFQNLSRLNSADLARYRVQGSDGQLVRNGDCVTEAGANVELQTGSAGDRSAAGSAGCVRGLTQRNQPG
jgi:hypothetical protein